MDTATSPNAPFMQLSCEDGSTMSLNADAEEGDTDSNEPVKRDSNKLAVFGGGGRGEGGVEATSSSQEYTMRSNELGHTAMFG